MPLEGEYRPGTSEWSRTQAERYEASDGQDAGSLRGVPVVVITSVGAKTGDLRKNPVMRVEHDGRYLAVASKGGTPEPPAWYFNIVKNPHVELQDGVVTKDYTARELSGDERAEWWDRAVAVWPDYANYQTKTDRQIQLFLLEPHDS